MLKESTTPLTFYRIINGDIPTIASYLQVIPAGFPSQQQVLFLLAQVFSSSGQLNKIVKPVSNWNTNKYLATHFLFFVANWGDALIGKLSKVLCSELTYLRSSKLPQLVAQFASQEISAVQLVS